jgi:hypothetical protein
MGRELGGWWSSLRAPRNMNWGLAALGRQPPDFNIELRKDRALNEIILDAD